MIATATAQLNPIKILTRAEIAAILAEQLRRSRRSVNSQMNLLIFRLATCCGLRVSEIAGLSLADVHITTKPHIRVPKSIAKRGKARFVPLWLDRATLSEIAAWKGFRQSQGADGSERLICSLRKGMEGRQLCVRSIQYKFKTVLRASLSPERVEQLSIHAGRHSFCSHLLARGFNLAQVRDWAGHASISTTSIYLHADVDPDAGVKIMDTFDF